MKFLGVGTLEISDKEKQYVNEVLDSNRLSYGPFSKKFEKTLAERHGCKFGIINNSGTSALHVALAACKEKYNWADGDEVLVPAVTFVASANIVIHNNMKPVWVDVEKEYYGIDPDLIEAKITPKTKAILVVHLFGQPCQMDRIMELAEKHNLRVIEDSCETMFASFKEKPVGSFGDMGCFSMYVAHILTCGVGGVCTTNDPDLAVAMRSLVNHGRDSIYISIDDDKGKDAEALKEIVAKRFSFVRLGHSFRITEMEAALGVAQLEVIDEYITKRRANADFFNEQLKDVEQLQLPKVRDGAEHSYMMYPIVIKDQPKTELVNYLEQHGIETRDMMPLINQPIYHKLYDYQDSDYPIADWINKSGFYIAVHQGLTDEDKQRIVDTIKAFFAQ